MQKSPHSLHQGCPAARLSTGIHVGSVQSTFTSNILQTCIKSHTVDLESQVPCL